MKKYIVTKFDKFHGEWLLSEKDGDSFIENAVKNNSFGLPERKVHENDMDEVLLSRSISMETVIDQEAGEEIVQRHAEDEEGNPVYDENGELVLIDVIVELEEVSHKEYLVPADYVIEIQDITEEYEAEKKLQARKKALQNIDEKLLEALAEQAEGRPEKLTEYLALRAEAKQNTPL